MTTNHRIGYTYFNIDVLFGDIVDPTHHSTRTFTTDYPTTVKNYFDIVNKEFKNRQINEKVSKLVNEAKWHEWSNKLQRK